MKLPGNIPVAATSVEALMSLGCPWALGRGPDSLVIVTNDMADPCIVWASPKLRGYKAVWDSAAALGFVEPASEWGSSVDIDHVFPKSWANSPELELAYVRLFPVWAEVNRSAGGGREKDALQQGVFPKPRQGIFYAEELQVLKILGHPVGTVSCPESIFSGKRGR